MVVAALLDLDSVVAVALGWSPSPPRCTPASMASVVKASQCFMSLAQLLGRPLRVAALVPDERKQVLHGSNLLWSDAAPFAALILTTNGIPGDRQVAMP